MIQTKSQIKDIPELSKPSNHHHVSYTLKIKQETKQDQTGVNQENLKTQTRDRVENCMGGEYDTFPTPPSPSTTSLYIVILPAMAKFLNRMKDYP
jgi:hypothetical protein